MIKIERFFFVQARLLFVCFLSLGLGFVNRMYPNQERIISFHADITVHVDATLEVTETISVWSTGNKIKRGIVRTFPTRYKTQYGRDVVIDFKLKQVLKEGKPVFYELADQANGKRIVLGDDTLIGNGKHTYTISYTVDRQLGFYKEYDEFYWNVTGNGWDLPIERACAHVYLPNTITITSMRNGVVVKNVQTDGYTGSYGTLGSNYHVQDQADGSLLFCATKTLRPYEGLTVVVIWPKGFIAEPEGYSKVFEPLRCAGWWDFIGYNKYLLWALFGSLLLVAFIIWSWAKKKAYDKRIPVFPQFYPPEGISAGAARYIVKKGFDATVLAAEVMSLAVRGFLTIEYDKWKGYSLIQKESMNVSGTGYEYALLADLFSRKDSLFTPKADKDRVYLTSSAAVRKAARNFEVYLDKAFGASSIWHSYFVTSSFFGLCSFFIFCCGIVLPCCLHMSEWGGGVYVAYDYYFALVKMWLMVFIGLLAVIYCIIFWYLFHDLSTRYTPLGEKGKADLDGFKMFLEATESERLKVIGTPPDKTPELYETYLPYAVALGVEKAWSKQFAPVFERLEKAGTPYVFVWYHGNLWSHGGFRPFASSFGSSFNTAISSSSYAPGTRSGFGGRSGGGGGFSGGGGGGGGGGGR